MNLQNIQQSEQESEKLENSESESSSVDHVIDQILHVADQVGYPTGENLVDKIERIKRQGLDSMCELINTHMDFDQVAMIRDLCNKRLESEFPKNAGANTSVDVID